jgi:hypothetical protein
MISLARNKQSIAPWSPAVFCAALSLITVYGIVTSVGAGGNDWGWAVPFVCFLPMCFVFVGMAMSGMRREISELRKQVAELRQDNGRESR